MATRRQLMIGSGVLATAAMSLAHPATSTPHDGPTATATATHGTAGLLRPGTRVLFQGDSITDVQRRRSITAPNSPAGLGHGYPALVARRLLRERPDDGLLFFNRGISGDTVARLHRRWAADTVALRPDVLSILIGVNDYWNRHRTPERPGSAAIYREQLDALLRLTRERLPATTIMLCEPFLLPTGHAGEQWIRDLTAYRRAARELAEVHGTRFVAFQTAMDAALQKGSAERWSADGVHPTPEGARVLADAWVRSL